jgi:hypothetical protein
MTDQQLYQAEVPAVAGVRACLLAGLADVPGLRVDEHVLDGAPTAPMCLVETAGPSLHSETMVGRYELVRVRIRVTCIGTSVEQVIQLRGRAARALVARSVSGWAVPLAVAGTQVLLRELTEAQLPPPAFGGGWGNAVLPVTLTLQPVT